MEPAIAEYPTRLIIVKVSPWINDGSASGIITLNIISFVVAPIALDAKLSFKDDTILVEDKDSPYVNIVTVLKGRENEEKIQKLIKALQSEKVKKYIDEKYNGSVVAAF